MQILYFRITKCHLRLFICSLIFLTLATAVNGQDASIDSLQQLLSGKSSDDRKRVDVLNELGYLYWVINSRESVLYGNKAFALADSIKYQSGAALARRVLGVGYWTQGDLKLALENLNEAGELYMQEGAANCLMNTGMVYAEIQEYGKAPDIYNRSIQKFTELGLNGA